MPNLADFLIPTGWAQPKPPPCPVILEQMQRLIDNAPTDKARRYYQDRKTLYLKGTDYAIPRQL